MRAGRYLQMRKLRLGQVITPLWRAADWNSGQSEYKIINAGCVLLIFWLGDRKEIAQKHFCHDRKGNLKGCLGQWQCLLILTFVVPYLHILMWTVAQEKAYYHQKIYILQLRKLWIYQKYWGHKRFLYSKKKRKVLVFSTEWRMKEMSLKGEIRPGIW